MPEAKGKRFHPYVELVAISDQLVEILERSYFGVQFCILLVGSKGNDKADSRLVSNIDKDDLRKHFLKILDNPGSIENEPLN